MAAIIWEDIPEAYDPDRSRDIAAVEGRIPAQLTRVAPDPDRNGELVYRDEVSATFGVVDHRVDYRCGTAEKSITASAGWYRLEVQVARTEKRVQSGMHLALARGRFAGWSDFAPFKLPNKKGESEGKNPLSEPAGSLEQVIERVEQHAVDYWEKGDYLTAGLSVPPEPQLNNDRNYSRGPWVLGVCSDFDACRELLWSHRHVEELLDLTENRNLGFGPQAAPEHYRRLCDEAREDGPLLMELAIRQAIAGPDFLDRKECVAWIGRPAVKLVEQVYCDHVYNSNRSVIDKDTRERERLDRLRDRYRQFLRERGQRPRPRHDDD